MLSAHAAVPEIGWVVLAETPKATALVEVAELRSTVNLIAALIALANILGLAFLYAALRGRANAERARRTAEDQRARESAAASGVTDALASSGEIDATLRRVLEVLGTNLGWQLGEAWLVEDGLLMQVASWDAPTQDASAPRDLSGQACHLGVGKGLSARAVAQERILWTEDTQHPDALDPHPGVTEPRHMAVAIPIRGAAGAIGALEFSSGDVHDEAPALAEVLQRVCAHVGEFTERKRAEERAGGRARPGVRRPG